MVPEFPILFGREQRPTILHSAVDAAVLVIANADKLTGVGHRQRLQQHGMYQRENRSSRANAQRQRQHRCDRKSGTPNKLPQRISNVFKKHGKPPYSNLRSPERSGSRGAYVTANGQIKRNVRLAERFSSNFIPMTAQPINARRRSRPGEKGFQLYWLRSCYTANTARSLCRLWLSG